MRSSVHPWPCVLMLRQQTYFRPPGLGPCRSQWIFHCHEIDRLGSSLTEENLSLVSISAVTLGLVIAVSTPASPTWILTWPSPSLTKSLADLQQSTPSRILPRNSNQQIDLDLVSISLTHSFSQNHVRSYRFAQGLACSALSQVQGLLFLTFRGFSLSLTLPRSGSLFSFALSLYLSFFLLSLPLPPPLSLSLSIYIYIYMYMSLSFFLSIF